MPAENRSEKFCAKVRPGEGLVDRVDGAGPVGLVGGVDRLILEAEGADLEADGAGAARQREGEAAPAVAGVGDVVVGADHGPGRAIRAERRGVVVERADVGGDGREGPAERRAAGAGAEAAGTPPTSCRNGVLSLVSAACAANPAGDHAQQAESSGQTQCSELTHIVRSPGGGGRRRMPAAPCVDYCAKFTTVNRPTLRASPASMW